MVSKVDNSKTKRIAFDVHGTLDCGFSNVVMDVLNKCLGRGDEVFIISGPPEEQIREEVIALGINPEDIVIISVVDWLKSNGVDMWQDAKNTWWCNDHDWWTSKGNICEIYQIDMIFDDMIGYLAATPPTTKFMHCVAKKDTEEFEIVYYASGGASGTVIIEKL